MMWSLQNAWIQYMFSYVSQITEWFFVMGVPNDSSVKRRDNYAFVLA